MVHLPIAVAPITIAAGAAPAGTQESARDTVDRVRWPIAVVANVQQTCADGKYCRDDLNIIVGIV